MAVTDHYSKLKTDEKDRMFQELFELRARKKVIEDQIEIIEGTYKPDLKDLKHDLFYELSNGLRFSIKRSERKGSVDTKKMESNGIDVDGYRKKPSVIYTVRVDGE